MTSKEALATEIDQLPNELIDEVLDFVQFLKIKAKKSKTPKGKDGSYLRKFANVIDPADLQIMKSAIGECERIDSSEW